MDYNITYRQKDKGWQFIISYKINGKWKQKSKQGFKAKKDAKPVAEKMVLELIKEFKTGMISDQSYNNIILQDLMHIYLEHIALYKEYNTIQGYKYAFSKFSNLYELKVNDIKKAHIQKCVDSIIKEGLCTKTIYTYTNKMKILLEYYKENFDTLYIVFNDIKIPRDKKDTNKKALTKSEFDELLLKLKGTKYYLVALIAGTCGLRCSEILGLTWKDIDFDNCLLTVNKQWKIDKKTRKSTFGEVKGKKSYRSIPIPPVTISILKTYKKKNVIDTNQRIAPYSHTEIKKYLNPVLKNICGISIHELRHTYATFLIASNIDFKTAAKFLGHGVQQTIKTYSHVTDDMIKKATDTISKIF
ncbi:site-specific integrase [Clostridium saccharobutylicum]|uniref:Site-specific recombinase XerD n=1 Tax=Clostridium saccharobutylicum DSM 13864 TaxID=1345695 RepID=U5MRQ4_CLOSA|nr:site-specific integrase [Clostridium saccharobutylicum]AGX43290.1 site-specific recombinase XerD [Clostridium saccharobutylicum DSM 13864]AQR90590.1 tyrosine recombinase XerC [Clostridium saccharobutylicum]AQS00494.1 tyrosine recombinase XerC [Clostridium saccharobutylicum]AQS10144.1 tyrosine recombinase XerC [Clostridium saccharobutylicum]AQS14477.1 tyrosine recombinase XerC [Clostridium saccharobutylicum]